MDALLASSAAAPPRALARFLHNNQWEARAACPLTPQELLALPTCDAPLVRGRGAGAEQEIRDSEDGGRCADGGEDASSSADVR